MQLVGLILAAFLVVIQWILIIRVILSWVELINPEWTPKGVMLVIAETVYTVTDPPLKLLRRFVKPLRVGRVALDMSVLVFFLIILILTRVVSLVFFRV
ncbi:MAG: YggT family protein [Propionibacteriaceae bacterium]|jgi:YggT family protein|nr:YggT family protein [Propionibacteriaceae bacterium]